MITENVPVLSIHKLTQAQYDRELAAGTIDENALYLTPDKEFEISVETIDGLQEALDEKSPIGHTHTAADVGAVPTSRTVNGKALSSNITLSASDVSAVPTSRTVNGKALSSNVTLSAADVGAAASNHEHTGYAPAYQYGTADLTAGSSALASGTLYFVYE